MGLIASAYARLSQPDAIRDQLLTHLFLARVHNSLKSSYERYLASPCSNSRTNYAGGWQLGHTWHSNPGDWEVVVAALEQPAEEEEEEESVPKYKLTRRKKKRREKELRRPTREISAPSIEREWDWRGFPSLWRPLVVYDWFSICWMSLASIRTLFHEQLKTLVEPLSRWLLNGLPGHCLLIGRMAEPIELTQQLTVLFASYHLGWRLAQARAKRSRLITMIVFLLASERDIKRACATFDECERTEVRTHSDPRPSDNEYDNHHLLVPVGLVRRTRAKQQPSSQATNDETSRNERLFRQVMCYQVHRSQRVYFRLRPNRSLEAHRLLKRRVAAVSLVTLIFFLLEFIIAVSLISVTVLSDYSYARTYPGCFPKLDERLARGELSYFSSSTLRDHHLLTVCADALENFVFWADSGLSITFVPALTYMLNYDLLLYWSELNRKLESLAERSKYVYLTQVQVDVVDLAGSGQPPVVCRLESMRALESDIHELQFEMYDFFHQVRQADLIVGDILTHAILIWLGSCAFFSYKLFVVSKGDSQYMSIITELIFFLGFFVITLASYHLLELRRCCLRSYRSLCTLMAYDRTRKKRSFIKLMDFYLGARNSTTYHLCRTYAYEPTTFITIIGWTFSCFFIAFTLFKPHSSAQAATQLDPVHNEN